LIGDGVSVISDDEIGDGISVISDDQIGDGLTGRMVAVGISPQDSTLPE
jgi:hypothetical protein